MATAESRKRWLQIEPNLSAQSLAVAQEALAQVQSLAQEAVALALAQAVVGQ